MLGGERFSFVRLAFYTAVAGLMVAQAKGIAPLVGAGDSSMVIPGHYIVIFEEGQVGGEYFSISEHENWLTNLVANQESGEEDARIDHKLDIDGIRGYSGMFSDAIIEQIRQRPEVKYIEEDQIVYALDLVEGRTRKQILQKELRKITKASGRDGGQSVKKQTKKQKKPACSETIVRQTNAPWGLSRVSHGKMPAELTKYKYPKSAGKGVDVYVIDTGINVSHADFEGRARWGATIPFGDIDIDGNGHGTHCAGTIASRTYGIAKKARVIAVKVLRTNGFGTNADVIKGVEWVIKAARRGKARGRKSAANMSLGGGRSITLEDAVNKAVESGVHFAVAAGNDNEDACDYSPAGAESPMTVGATTNQDQIAFFSNHGPCVDIFAPGMDITSTWIGSRKAVNTISGTSMAAPHVAGVMALYLGERDYDTAALKALIIEHANLELVKDMPEGTENRLLCTRSLIKSA